MGFTREELLSYAGRTIPDLVGDDLRLLFVGINPGLVSAATGLHFAHPGNRFYPALRLAGILPEDVTTPADARAVLVERGIGITNIVARASARSVRRRAPATCRRDRRHHVVPRRVRAQGRTSGPPGRDDRRGAAVGRAQSERAERPRDGRLARRGLSRSGCRGGSGLT